MNLIKSFIKNNIPIGRMSYSQEGEDLILNRIFNAMGLKKGFYVDVGAHHPYRFSNTLLLYRQGWKGINIDPMPGSKIIFDKKRGRDINIECGVGDIEGELTYYMFNEPALNTFSLNEVTKKSNTKYFVRNEQKIKIIRLDSILNKYLPAGIVIDFLNIDAEGFDEKILLSNDWKKYRPKIILVEILNRDLYEIEDLGLVKLLRKEGYLIIAKTYNTYIWKLL
jgi:FkbM family methyltransferase